MRRRSAVVALVGVLLFAAFPRPFGRDDVAVATPNASASSSAAGVSTALTLSSLSTVNAAVSVGPLPTASGTAPPPYNVNNTAVAGAANLTAPVIGTLLTTGVLNATATSSVAAASPTDPVSGTASVNNLALNVDVPVVNALGNPIGLNDLLFLGADAVTSNASVVGPCGGPLVASGSTSIVNGVVQAGSLAQVSVAASPAPNTNLATALIAAGGSSALVGNLLNTIGASILLNEQIVTGDGTNARSITVNAIHVILNINSTTNVLGIGTITLLRLTGNVIVSQSQASLSCVAAPGQTADLSVSVQDGPDPVSINTDLTYTITVANGGANTASSVVLTDTVPSGATLQSVTPSQGTCSGTTTLTCNLGDIANGGTATVTIVVRPTQAGTATNTASVSSNTPDPTGANNQATSTTTVNAAGGAGSADLSITVNGNPNPIAVGNPVTYTLNVSNAGPDAATAVVASDTLPSGVTFVSATPSQGTCSQAAGVVSCGLGTVNSGATTTVTIIATATTPGPASNLAQVTSGVPDPNTSNNLTTTSITINPPGAGSANLAITKTSAPSPATVGSPLTYTLTSTSSGPDAATGVVVVDSLPATVTFTSATSSQGTCSQAASVVTCNLGTIANGGTATVTIVVTPTAAGQLTNTATISSALQDPSAANNTAVTTTTVSPAGSGGSADLSLTLVDQPDPVNVNGTLIYTAVLTNNGPASAPGVIVTDSLPAGVSLVSATPSQGTCSTSGNAITCSLGTVATGGTATVLITVIPLTPGPLSTVATVSSGVADPNPANNQATASTTVSPAASGSANISVSKTAAPNPASVNAPLVYTVTVRNAGPDAAPGVVVVDAIPGGLTIGSISSTAGSCSLSGRIMTCTIGALASGASAVVTIGVTPTTVGVIRNSATATSGLPDPSVGDNISGVDITVTGVGQEAPTTVKQDEDDTDKPHKLTEEQRQQRQRTNTSNRDDEHTEGNVMAVACDAVPPTVSVANRDGIVTVVLQHEATAVCTSIKVGDYVEADGQKEHEQLFYADSLDIASR